MKNDLFLMYFHAYWDSAETSKRKFAEACKEYNYPFTFVDCETKEGLDLSIKYGIKMCPRVGIFYKGKLMKIINGKYAANYIVSNTVLDGGKYRLIWKNEKNK